MLSHIWKLRMEEILQTLLYWFQTQYPFRTETSYIWICFFFSCSPHIHHHLLFSFIFHSCFPSSSIYSASLPGPYFLRSFFQLICFQSQHKVRICQTPVRAKITGMSEISSRSNLLPFSTLCSTSGRLLCVTVTQTHAVHRTCLLSIPIILTQIDQSMD